MSRDFDPPDVLRQGASPTGVGDQRSGALYVYSPKVKLAVRVALVTGRPLLVRGPPGWGKSSLARSVANYLKWRYLEEVVSSRTQARDLMSKLDLVRRLSDAQRRDEGVDPDWRRYIRPGVLWEAFAPSSAARQRRFFDRAETPADREGPADTAPFKPAVVLLDEMDKADPDVPNNLLVALGSLQFTVDEIVDKDVPLLVKAREQLEPLIIVTTNDERDLPRAFLRRCVEIALPALEKDDDQDGKQRIELLVKIGVEHLKGLKDRLKQPLDETYVRGIAQIIAQAKGGEEGLVIPSPAEFIDTLRAVGELYGSSAQEDEVKKIVAIAVRKRGVSGV
jgi:MoxR-like ATPase